MYIRHNTSFEINLTVLQRINMFGVDFIIKIEQNYKKNTLRPTK